MESSQFPLDVSRLSFLELRCDRITLYPLGMTFVRLHEPSRFLIVFLLFSTPISSVAGNVNVSVHGAALSSSRGVATPSFLLQTRLRHLTQSIHRYNVNYDGLPVYYEFGTVQTDESGTIRRLKIPGTISVVPHTHPSPESFQVAKWVRDLGYSLLEVGDSGWLLDDSGSLRSVVTAYTRGRFPDAFLTLYLDATSGRILDTDLLFQTQSVPIMVDADPQPTMGSVYPENPVTTPVVVDEPLIHLDSDTSFLYGKYVRAETCNERDTCDTSSPIAERSDLLSEAFVFNPQFSIDPEAADPFAEVNAYRNITRIASWIHDEFGWDGLFAEETWITVRVGQIWDNAAYFSGTKKVAPYITFGAETVNYAYDADTAYHEYGHAINDLFWRHSWRDTDEYGMNLSMFAMEEALADVWAATLAGDPVLNAYVTASRTVDNAATCPGSIFGEGHYDSRFVSGFLWDVREAIGALAFNHILYRSLGFLEKKINFTDFIDALEQSASDLSEEGVAGVKQWHVDLIQETARARGLFSDACLKRLVPLRDNETRYAIGYGRDKTKKTNYPFGLQWEVTAEGGDAIIRVMLSWIFPESNDEGDPVNPGYCVHVRKNFPVEVLWRDPDTLEEGDDAFDVVADYTWDDSPTVVEYPLIDGVPLESGEKLYLLVSALSQEPNIVIKANMSTVVEASGEPPEDSTARSDFSGDLSIGASDGVSSCIASPSSTFTPGSLFSFVFHLL